MCAPMYCGAGLLLCVFTLSTLGSTGVKGAEQPHGGTSAVALKPRPTRHLGEGVAVGMLPEVLAGPAVTAAVAARINHSLEKFNAEVLSMAQECKTAEQSMGPDHLADFERSVTVTMQGPRFLSLEADDGYSCGGPHPEDDQLALVYDLATGSPVNWTRLLPKEAIGKVDREKGRLAIGYVEWPLIITRAKAKIAALDADDRDACANAYSEQFGPIPLNVTLSAKEHAVVFTPQLGSHYERALCTEQIKIGAAEAKRLGFAAELISAIAN